MDSDKNLAYYEEVEREAIRMINQLRFYKSERITRGKFDEGEAWKGVDHCIKLLGKALKY